ncbi:MAG: hypothetical protein PHH26_07480, partial [Candidatus Thermoplasmatota archaeon]|nr:hypothetical protein [Candidatus Thermoplasmatota archaeon]
MEFIPIRKIARLKNPGSGWLAYSIIACGIVLLLGIQYFIGLMDSLPFTGAVALLSFAGCALAYYRETSKTKTVRAAIANSMILASAVYVIAMGIVMGTALQIEAALFGKELQNGPISQADVVFSIIMNFITMFFAVVAFVLIRRKGISSIGLSFKNFTANALLGTLAGVMLFMLLVAVVFVLTLLGVNLPQSESGAGFSTIGIPLAVAVSLSAAITEETFFRGFLQNRIGLIAASILFGFAHIGYGTVAQIVFPFIYAL